ncbi:hypothetical protein C8F04DRAFT_966413, partial [Mycena alexandri]
MTDYSSQGKTRVFNVVDLNQCRTHHSFYTALSRSKSAEGTLIVQGFTTGAITGGIKGWLRQEFRELELLNEITRLRYEDKLPAQVKGAWRSQLIQTYQAWKGAHYDPADLHHSLRWKAGDVPRVRPVIDTDWDVVLKERKAEEKMQAALKAEKTSVKRKAKATTPIKAAKRPREVEITPPPGTMWDVTNWSCAYDSLVVPLYDIWQSHVPKWSTRFEHQSGYAKTLAGSF